MTQNKEMLKELKKKTIVFGAPRKVDMKNVMQTLTEIGYILQQAMQRVAPEEQHKEEKQEKAALLQNIVRRNEEKGVIEDFDKHRSMATYEEGLPTHLGRLLHETRDIALRKKIKCEQYLKERRQISKTRIRAATM